MTIPTERYLDQRKRWPSSGRHILAHFDAETIIVYQSYSHAIGSFAIRHGYFGGQFSYKRMSWIKPNFLWMMYRSNWGRSVNQNVVLAIRLRRIFFDSLLQQSVPSCFDQTNFASQTDWETALGQSDVRAQWDPDHMPNGSKEERRAIQLGLRGPSLEAYGKREIVEITDMSGFVASQRENAADDSVSKLMTPIEQPYHPMQDAAGQRIGLNR